MHVTLYRKYRPQDFEEIAGQEEIVKALSAALKSGKMSHAYLFSGPRGLGKTTIARLIAKGVNCETGVTDAPCNQCSCCQSINAGNFPDMIEIDAASNRGINEIREIKDKINYKPAVGRKKIYIIDEVHMLTKEAFNALLKTLEEPPEHVIFVLATTEPDKVLPTIVSRCQRYDFRPVSCDKMSERLNYIIEQEKIDIEPEVLPIIYENASGGMRDSISILERLMITCLDQKITVEKCEEILGITPTMKMQEFLAKLQTNDIGSAVRKLDEYWKESIDIEDFFKDFAKYCKNLMEKKELSIEKGLEIIDAIYTSLSKFKYEEDKRLAGYVIVSDIASRHMILAETVQTVQTTRATHPSRETASDSVGSEELKDINVTLEDVLAKWNDVLGDIKNERVTAIAFLHCATPVKLEKNVLYIGFDVKYAYHKEMAERPEYRDPLTEVLRRRIDPSIIVKCVITGKPKETVAKKDSTIEELEDFFGKSLE